MDIAGIIRDFCQPYELYFCDLNTSAIVSNKYTFNSEDELLEKYKEFILAKFFNPYFVCTCSRNTHDMGCDCLPFYINGPDDSEFTIKILQARKLNICELLSLLSHHPYGNIDIDFDDLSFHQISAHDGNSAWSISIFVNGIKTKFKKMDKHALAISILHQSMIA